MLDLRIRMLPKTSNTWAAWINTADWLPAFAGTTGF